MSCFCHMFRSGVKNVPMPRGRLHRLNSLHSSSIRECFHTTTAAKKNNTPQSHHGLFDLCRGFCCSCCLRAKSLPHNDIIFENNLFLCLSRLLCPLCTRCLRESASLCFASSEFLCLFRTYSYALIFTTGIPFLLSTVCIDFCTSSIFRYGQFPVYFLSILRCTLSDSDPVCVNFECFSNRLND